MDPESHELLKETLELAKENNEMLVSMRRSMRIARVMSVVYWIFIIGSAVGAYYLIQPYIEQLISVYDGAKGNIENINGVLENFKQ
jgi:hypothetical protein